MRIEDVGPIEDVLALLDGWKIAAEAAGVELTYVGVRLPAIGDSTWKHNVNFVYNDTGMETPETYWEIQPIG